MKKDSQNQTTFFSTELESCRQLSFVEKVNRAIRLLKDNEPKDGYHLAFSGGKDSCVIKKLARMAGVKFDAWYSSTTIDPPELIRFIKKFHSDVKWAMPKHGSMMHRVANKPSPPPTRLFRWCCSEYKEAETPESKGRLKIFGVRAAESKAREARWKEVVLDVGKFSAICPIVYWTDGDVWKFIRQYKVDYCSLYDEGWTRLGCVGCPLASRDTQKKEFARWPAFERNWKNAIVKSWEKWHDKKNRKGETRFHSKFKSGEELWQWWLNEKKTKRHGHGLPANASLD